MSRHDHEAPRPGLQRSVREHVQDALARGHQDSNTTRAEMVERLRRQSQEPAPDGE
jgi:hypothetical protein